MSIGKRMGVNRWQSRVGLVGCTVWGLACGATSQDEADRESGVEGAPASAPAGPIVCPTCPAWGGESSDFGGSLHPCALFEQREGIDAERAAELGFDVPTLKQRVEREVDAPLRWTPGAERPAAGYAEETRVQVQATVQSYTYVRLDADRCDGNDCFDDAVGSWVCSDRLELGIDGELRTLDGAVDTRASGYVLQGRPGFPFVEPAGDLFASLRDVRGSLEVFPDPDLEVRRALLITNLFFNAEQTEGDILADLLLSGDGGFTGVAYMPLSGHWPDAR